MRLSRYAVAQYDLNAKLKDNFHTAKKKLKKFIDDGFKLKLKAKSVDDFVKKLATAIGLYKDSINTNSVYCDFSANGVSGKFRVSSHHANGDLMSKGDFDQRISVFVYNQKGKTARSLGKSLCSILTR